MPISDKAKAYKSWDDKWMLLGDGIGFGHGDVYFSPDGGKTFFQLDQTGWGNMRMSYGDPHFQTKMEFYKPAGEDIIREVGPEGLGRIYRLANLPTSYEIVLLPHIRQTRYFFCMLNGEGIIYVNYDRYYPNEPLHIYFGSPETMKKLKITAVTSSTITTEQGLLEVGGYLPRWEGLQLASLNEKNYVIIETDGGLTITKKS